MVLDQAPKIAVKRLIRDSLPGFEVEPRLIESPAEPLPVLRDEAGHESTRRDGANQNQPVQQATQDAHCDAAL
jgi:hypothetical protein